MKMARYLTLFVSTDSYVTLLKTIGDDGTVISNDTTVNYVVRRNYK